MPALTIQSLQLTLLIPPFPADGVGSKRVVQFHCTRPQSHSFRQTPLKPRPLQTNRSQSLLAGGLPSGSGWAEIEFIRINSISALVAKEATVGFSGGLAGWLTVGRKRAQY
jgi:hypothetical protein